MRQRAWLALALLTACMPPAWGANALLHPGRRITRDQPVLVHEDLSITADDGVILKGWLFRTSARRRGLIVSLHGIGDNRGSSIGLASRFVPEGWDVLAYDARAHGDSGGAFCSYGVLERRDLSRALDTVKADSAVLFGTSLGGSVALQAAATEPRVRGVIAQSAFSDLRRVAHERAPFFASDAEINEAFALAEAEGHFKIDDASPLKLASQIHVPVFLIHGASDRETPPSHSEALFAALSEPKKLLLVPGAGHNDTLSGADAWVAIEDWLKQWP